MTYAKVHDRTVAEDYYSAMAEVEKRILLTDQQESTQDEKSESERTRLLELAAQLAVPRLNNELRLDLVAQIRFLLGDSPSTNLVSSVLAAPG